MGLAFCGIYGQILYVAINNTTARETKSRLFSGAIMYGSHTFFVGAVRATIASAARLDSMPYYFAAAMFTFRRQGMDGALKTIEIP